jgi:uncharacterized protein YjiS (DUF1127 family)
MIMSTLSLTRGEAAAVPAKTSWWWSRLFRRVVEARERQAQRIIAYHLATLTDERLEELGLTAAEIAALRCRTSYAEHLVS